MVTRKQTYLSVILGMLVAGLVIFAAYSIILMLTISSDTKSTVEFIQENQRTNIERNIDAVTLNRTVIVYAIVCAKQREMDTEKEIKQCITDLFERDENVNSNTG